MASHLFIGLCVVVKTLGVTQGDAVRHTLFSQSDQHIKCSDLIQQFGCVGCSPITCLAMCRADVYCRGIRFDANTNTCYGCGLFTELPPKSATEHGLAFYVDGNWPNYTTSVRFNADSGLPNEGRIEVRDRGRWHTICDTFWNSEGSAYVGSNMDVFCRMLGYDYGGESLPRLSYPIENENPNEYTGIYVHGIMCRGTEESLSDCPFVFAPNRTCSHDNDISLRCLIAAQ